MNESKISVRYAKALFLLAKEDGELASITDDVKLIADSCQIADFNLVLESPVLKSAQKQAFFQSVFKNRLHTTTSSFLNLLIKNKREAFLAAIMRNFLSFYKKEQGVKTVTITAATAVDAKFKAEISQFVKDKFNATAELHEVINEKLIGGFILRIEDLQFDASVSSKLQQIERELVNTTI